MKNFSAAAVPSEIDSRDEGEKGLLGSVPRHQRDRVLSGIRWTVWLSAMAVPFSAGTNLLLARVGPETIGVYGLLAVYVGLVASFVYFGGDPVVMRFIPECKTEDRTSFLASYYLVILAALSCWIGVAYCFPSILRLVLGGDLSDQARFIMLCLSALPVAFWMVVSALKGMLDIRFSQIVGKLLPISTFFAYAVVFILDRQLFVRAPFLVVWAVYLLPMLVLGAIGLYRVIRQCDVAKFRFFLPKGFWRYALGTEQTGMAVFLAYRFDYILVVNHGGLGMLGRYVAVLTIAGLVAVIDGFFMETLLPSLTNMLADRNSAGAAQVFTMHMRILFLVATATSCAIMVLGVAVTSLMGDKYRSVQSLIIFMALVQGIANPGLFGGTVLLSIGRQRLSTWSALMHAAVFATLFFVLWPHFGLTGAIIAYGVALTISWGSMMVIARIVAPSFPSVTGLWIKSGLIDAAVCIVSLYWMPLGIVSAAMIWICAMAAFLVLAGYGSTECASLIRMVVPGASPARRRPIKMRPSPIEPA